MQSNYRMQADRATTKKLRLVIDALPNFCDVFFRAIEEQNTPLTRLNYAYDLALFFKFLMDQIDHYQHIVCSKDFTIADMNALQAVDLDIYLEYLSYYEKNDIERENHASSKERKLSSVRVLCKYLFKQELILSNVASLVDLPKKHQKSILRLEPDEVAKILDIVESAQGLSDRQKSYLEHTKKRDLAMLTLFLSTGIRVSECIGINLSDVDFTANAFMVTRKGGDRVILYFSEEAAKPLKAYILERMGIVALPGHESALFLSLQKKRMDVRSIEKMIKKYAAIAAPLKNISPHKLRSTFGTMLYQETGDIYLVADVLGHADVNTTRKHYAAMSDEKRRIASKAIKLRDD